jgi:hypothetical protein
MFGAELTYITYTSSADQTRELSNGLEMKPTTSNNAIHSGATTPSSEATLPKEELRRRSESISSSNLDKGLVLAGNGWQW